MNDTDAQAACQRLIHTCERALALDAKNHASTGDTIREPLVAFVLALLRMRIQPALAPDWILHDPIHIALMGGTNSGKSTLVNVCLGRAAAGMRITARYSQYPEAYQPAELTDDWLDAFPERFAAYECYRDEHPPRHSDAALAKGRYQPRFGVLDPDRMAPTAYAPAATQQAVCWDAPDYSTEEAQAYMQAVLDVVALAEVVIVAVTDESYADDRGRMLFRLVRSTGVAVHVVANKLEPSPDLLADVQDKYVTAADSGPRMLAGLLPVQFYHLPKVAGGSTEDRLQALLQTPEATRLRESLAQEAERGAALKRSALQGSVRFLEHRIGEVFRPLERESEAAAVWEQTVIKVTQAEFFDRYRSEYLHSQRYGEFNQALIYLMELLEVPWIGPVMNMLRSVVRVPFRLVTSLVSRLLWRSDTAAATRPPEHEVVTQLFDAWLPALKAEAQTQASTQLHPAWTDIVQGLEDRKFRDRLAKNLEATYQTYHREIDAEVQRQSREIYTAVEQNPTLLHTLRGTNLVVDAATLVLVVKSGGIDWSDAVVGPIVAGLRRVLLDAGMEVYLESQKRALQDQQYAAIQQLVENTLVTPVHELFVREVQAEDIETARQDFAIVKAAALTIASQG